MNGMSLPDQQERLEAYFNYQLKPAGVLWGGLYVDAGVSAAKIPFANRPNGKVLYGRLKPGDHVIMTSLDRGFRRLRDASVTIEKWVAMGIHVHFLNLGLATSTPVGKLILHVLGAVAEFQRDILAEGTKMGLARRRELTGTHNGRVGPGDRLLYGKVAPCSAERSMAKLIVSLRDEGQMTWDDMSIECRVRGIQYRGKEMQVWVLKRLYTRCKLEQWEEPALVLPPVLKRVVQRPPSAPRVNRLVIEATTTVSSIQWGVCCAATLGSALAGPFIAMLS